MTCLPTDDRTSPAKKEKRASKSVEAVKAASWQQVLEYNTSQSAKDVTTAKTGSTGHTDESKPAISDEKHDACSSSVEISLPEGNSQSVMDQTAADSCDSLEVETGKGTLEVDEAVTSRSRSAQDLSTQPDFPAARHGSTDSLLKDGARTLPLVDRLRVQDAVVLSRRRSFSGSLHKAAAAVAVRYRGLRDSLKAASADLLTSGQEDLTQRANKVSLKDLGRQATPQSSQS